MPRARAPRPAPLDEADALGQVVLLVGLLGLRPGRARARSRRARAAARDASLAVARFCARTSRAIACGSSRSRPACAGRARGTRRASGLGGELLEVLPSRPLSRRARARAPSPQSSRLAWLSPRVRRSPSGRPAAGRPPLRLIARSLRLVDVLGSSATTCPRPRPRRRRRPPRRSRRPGAAPLAAAPSAALGGLLLLGALVHRLGDLVERGLQRLGLGVDLVRVLGGQRLADLLDRRLDLGPWRRRRPARRGP